MSRWIQHPVLVWSLLALFGVPNLLGQGFHVALHHSHGSHNHCSASADSTTACSHSHSHAKAESTPAKKHAGCHHRHSHSDAAQTERAAKLPAVSVATPGHDPHDCTICQYFSAAQVLAMPTECVVSVCLTSPLPVSLPAAVFYERYLAISPRGPPVA